MSLLPTATTGDVGDTREVQLGENVDGAFTVVDFTGLVDTVEAHVWRPGDRANSTTLTAAFSNEATGTIVVTLGTWLQNLTLPATVDEVSYLVEYEVTYLDTTVRTWGADTLPVRAQAA